MMFTARELDIMAVLWERGPSTIAEVRSDISDDLSHNTVATIMGILEDKGYVRHTAEGRAFRYAPLVAREEAATNALRRLAEKVFGGSAEALLTHFAKDRQLTRTELKRIRNIIDARVSKDQPSSPRLGRRA